MVCHTDPGTEGRGGPTAPDGVPLPTQLSNCSKLDTRRTIGGLEPRTLKVMQMQLQRRPSGLPDWLYVAIVAALGLYFVIGGIAWATFIHNGVTVPESFTTILATIAGGLVGVLTPSSAGPGRSASAGRDERRPPSAD